MSVSLSTCNAVARRRISSSERASSRGLTQIDLTGVLMASGSPLRSVIMPRCATNGSTRRVRASPCPCRKSRSINTSVSSFHSTAVAASSIAPRTAHRRHPLLCLTDVGLLMTHHHNARPVRPLHGQLLHGTTFNTSLSAEGTLFNQQLAPLHLQLVVNVALLL